MNAELVDTMEIFTMPVTLETGIALFTDDAWRDHFTMVAENTYDDGVVHTTYQTQNAATDT
jgi:dihydrofolate reductase